MKTTTKRTHPFPLLAARNQHSCFTKMMSPKTPRSYGRFPLPQSIFIPTVPTEQSAGEKDRPAYLEPNFNKAIRNRWFCTKHSAAHWSVMRWYPKKNRFWRNAKQAFSIAICVLNCCEISSITFSYFPLRSRNLRTFRSHSRSESRHSINFQVYIVD